MRKKNGFTLVELLAVIVILAIIMIIAIPAVLNALKTAQLKTFEEYITKTINLTEKQELSNNLLNGNSTNSCTIYNIKKDLGLSATGSFEGYILVNTTNEREYIITMWDSNNMILPYNYTKKLNSSGETKEPNESIIPYDSSKVDELSLQNLCSYGCGTCATTSETVTSTCDYSAGESWTFDYTGEVTNFNPACSGNYKLEVWGASGGDTVSTTKRGGYGGYSTGTINLSKNNKIYIAVGGRGEDGKNYGGETVGGFNGGGAGKSWNEPQSKAGSGGGATHIAYKDGLLKDLSDSKNSVIIVAGAGGGAHYTNGANGAIAGNGGGFKGTPLTKMLSDARLSGRISNPGTQDEGGCNTSGNSCGGFGYGGDPYEKPMYTHEKKGSGGGAGWYGGSGAYLNSGSGGSGYIGYSALKDKYMTCFECEESNDTGTKTITNECVSNDPTSDCSKIGNGYVKITYLG